MDNPHLYSKILIVDDESAVCNALKSFLENEQFSVDIASDGEAALTRLAEFKPDCVLLDIRMPYLSGVETLKMIKLRSPLTAVIMVTVVDSVKSVEECMKAGAFGYLTKPVNLNDLLEEIHGALDARQAAQPKSKSKSSLQSEKALTEAETLETTEIPFPEEPLELAKPSKHKLSVKIFEDTLYETIIFDAKTLNILRVNEKARENLKYDKKELAGRNILLLYPDYTKKQFESLLEPLRQKKSAVIFFETRHSRKDGSTYPVEVHLQLSKCDEQTLFLAVALDITETVAVKEELNKLTQVINLNPSSVIITDPLGHIEFVNDRFTETSGFSQKEVLGKHTRILKSGFFPSEKYTELWQTINSGSSWEGQFHSRRKNGELYWENATITPIKNKSGEITHFLCTKEDVTELKDTQDNMDHLNQKLSKTDQELKEAMAQLLQYHKQRLTSDKHAPFGQITVNAYHEMLNPLNNISLYIQLLLKNNPDPSELSRQLSLAQEEITRLEKIMTSLVNFSEKKYSGQKKSVNQVIEAALLQAEAEFKEAHIKFIRNLGRNLPDIEMNAEEIQQTLLNILHNSKDTMPEGGTITVYSGEISKCNMEYVQIYFRDTGQGIPKKHLDEIFTSDSTTKASNLKIGIGLPASRSCIQKHQGTFSIESEEGKGTCVTIELPLQRQEDSFHSSLNDPEP